MSEERDTGEPGRPLALPASRREFLRLMGASLSLSASGCLRRPAETIVPYAQAPEKIVPGRPLYYATSMTLGGYATGVLVESHEGRPTKIEGNPDHPASLGATDLFAQAQVLSLYDPDRSQSVLYQGRPATSDMFAEVMARELERLGSIGGQGLRLLTETVTSPTLGQQLRELLHRFPRARWHQYEPVHRDSARLGTTLAFGSPVESVHHLERARLVVSLGADFLSRGPSWVRDARRFIDGRRVAVGKPEMNRLVVVESGLSVTGSNADHRLALGPRDILRLARALASTIVPLGGSPASPPIAGPLAAWASWLTKELEHHRGASLVIAGEEQPPAVHALCAALNHALGNIGKTLEYTRPAVLDAGLETPSIQELARDMEVGAVSTLLILGGNPAYYAPVDLEFARCLSKVPLRVHLGLYRDETARLCHWHIPEAHPLESWSDARAYDGTVGLVQPLIAPLYGGRSAHELLSMLLGRAERSGYDLVRDFWRTERASAEFDTEWAQALQRGVIPGTALPVVDVTLSVDGVRSALSPSAAEADGMALLFCPDPTIWDGRFANNAWLEELPKPLSTLTWENAAQMSPNTARRLGVSTGDIVELVYRGRTLEAPVLVSPGHADETVLLSLGYGRTGAGRIGDGIGCNAYALRTAEAPWIGVGLEMRKTGRHRPLALTQRHHSMEGREPVRVSTLAEYLSNPHARHEDEAAKSGLTLFPPQKEEDEHRWGMAIDLTACIGCGACTLACQAENNIPVVGQREVLAGREMHWIRVDHYFRDSGHPRQPEVVHQPVPCMHCETAPCELVCPVAATVHDHEGLNEMVYNRCVGTRYCSNNCPYKVRRFNYFHYSQPRGPSLRLLQNPDVTVRSRGVMEKCTYCTQRISAARIRAAREDRPIRDGEIVPACAQACPTQAIVFGDLNDPKSRVRRYKESPLDYALLAELNTRPRTSYQARLQNPDPNAPAAPAKEES